jgi:hypothetical protein
MPKRARFAGESAVCVCFAAAARGPVSRSGLDRFGQLEERAEGLFQRRPVVAGTRVDGA